MAQRYQMNHKCKLCKYEKGRHQANTLNCPANGKQFTWFLNTTFVPSDRAPPKPKFTLGDKEV